MRLNKFNCLRKDRVAIIATLSLVILISCFNDLNNYTYSIQFNSEIKDETEYRIDSIIIKHSAKPYDNKNILSASKIIYYEDDKRNFTNDVPSNYIAKELYFKLSENKNYVVWHKGAELALLGRFYIKRKNGNKIVFDSIKHKIPFNYSIVN